MIVGIDLGTTNSLISVWEASGPRLIPNSLGDLLTPSCVSIDQDGTVLVGRAARDRLQTHPEMSTSVFKRFMGSGKVIRLGKRDFRPEELSALILRSLKEDAEAALGQPVTEAIITVPAYFSDAQRKATRAAGQLAGLKVERLLNEPTAAALAYGIQDTKRETKFLVFDLGGGTYDVSILELFDGVMEVRATAGDNFLGGEDIVSILCETYLTRSGLAKEIGDNEMTGSQKQRLRDEAERTKRGLTDTASVRMAYSYQGAEYSYEFSEETFASLCEPLIQRLPLGVRA